jgi:hypothetical protein
MINKTEIRKDILAFADDDSDVIIEHSGEIMFYKNGAEQICSIKSDSQQNQQVEYNGERLNYNEFISKKLARLDVFATKIKEKRNKIEAFVDGPAMLYTPSKSETGKALELLKKECDNFFEFGSKISFITADAGHGKSVLLKQFQYKQAERYLNKESNYLFWHIDLQGRDLVRLGEAIMYDLGELRMPGLYYPSIINLIQKKMIILAIDGFDELAAEIGGINAVSSLSNFINEMDGSGTLICASRRTFFDTGDYIKRTNIISREKPLDIIFNELKLRDWTKPEVVNYFNILDYDNSQQIYSNILRELQNDINHPILTRPFLLAKLEQSLERDAARISSFFSNHNETNDGVCLIVESFTKREVDKWKDRNATDQETGKPYLTFDQHIELLSIMAKEMWESKKDYLTKDEIELFTVLLVEDWGLSEDIKQKIVRLATSHAFLIPRDDRMNSRKFDHDEFRYYFLSRALAKIIDKCVEKRDFNELKRFLYIEQLPDSVATYCFNYVTNKEQNAEQIIHSFIEIVNKEWKPTYLQTNIGTLIPFLLNGLNNSNITINAKINYSSLIFESKSIKNIKFENSLFTNVSIRNSTFENVEFVNCEFSEIKFEQKSTNTINNVLFNNCSVNSLVILDEGQVVEIAYAPLRIQYLLTKKGISTIDTSEVQTKTKDTSVFKKSLLRFIYKYNKQMIQYEKSIREDGYLNADADTIIEKVVPLLEKHRIIEKIDTNASKQMRSDAWRLMVRMDILLQGDKEDTSNKYYPFWQEVNNYQDK